MKAALQFSIGMLAGLADLAGSIKTRDRILSWFAYTGATWNGFDLTSDLHRFAPSRWWRV